jgi:late competence protein required for DNA uptake (superfamily II DNA/RNA helicase)
MSKQPNHLHRFRRVNLGENGKEYYVFKCTLPTCTYYIPLKMAENALCECNRCKNPMLLTKAALQLAKPHCGSCVKRKKVVSETVNAITEFLTKTNS